MRALLHNDHPAQALESVDKLPTGDAREWWHRATVLHQGSGYPKASALRLPGTASVLLAKRTLAAAALTVVLTRHQYFPGHGAASADLAFGEPEGRATYPGPGAVGQVFAPASVTDRGGAAREGHTPRSATSLVRYSSSATTSARSFFKSRSTCASSALARRCRWSRSL